MVKIEKATFGAGCFWGIEEKFSKTKGIISTKVGFMGGKLKNPSYKQVCTGKTGHIEVTEVNYNSKKISYEKLLDIFWSIHNPFSKNRQGLNLRTQYNSIIFYHNEKQKNLALKSKEKIQKKYKDKIIITQIRKSSSFYKAEEYHQKYFEKNKIAGFLNKLFRK